MNCEAIETVFLCFPKKKPDASPGNAHFTTSVQAHVSGDSIDKSSILKELNTRK